MQTKMKIKKITIMGILNVTPDSFSDGGKYIDQKKAVQHALQMRREGADIIDIGGESTKPGSEAVSEEEELQRVIPIIKELKEHIDDTITISIDTQKSQVAEEALSAGASIVNSLGGFSYDEKLAEVVIRHQCPVILYHIKGKPKTMQQGTIAYHDVIKDIATFFENQIIIGNRYGIKQGQYILDPGIGFGKNIEQNITILKNLKDFSHFHAPILIGISRKSHLGMILQDKLNLRAIPSPEERLEASLAETAIAIQNGATIIRTHDVWQTKKFVTTFEEFL
jgi:dihydropteroate synthase